MKRLHNFANTCSIPFFLRWSFLIRSGCGIGLNLFKFFYKIPHSSRSKSRSFLFYYSRIAFSYIFLGLFDSKDSYRVEPLSQRDWSLVCHYSAYPIMPSSVTFVGIFCIVPGAWHIGISFFYCGWPFLCLCSPFVFLVDSLILCLLLENRQMFVEGCPRFRPLAFLLLPYLLFFLPHLKESLLPRDDWIIYIWEEYFFERYIQLFKMFVALV